MRTITRHLFVEILVFAGLLLALVLGLAWWGLTRALDSQAWERADASIERLSLELDREMRGVHSLGRTLQDWWVAGTLTPAETDRLDAQVIPLLARQTFVSSINFCAADGTSVLLLRTDGAWHTRALQQGPAGNRQSWVRRHPDGRVKAREPWIPTLYDPRRRDWYVLVKDAHQEAWSPEAYRFMTTRDPGLTLSLPVVKEGRLLGVVALDVLLDDLTEKAWRAQPTPGTRVAVTDALGRALILPQVSPYQHREARFQDFLKPMGQGVVPELMAFSDGLAALPEGGQRLTLRHGGQRFYGLARPYFGPSGLRWNLMVAIPAQEIMGASRAKGLAVLVLALAGFGVMAWRARVISERFGAPLDTLASAAQEDPPSQITAVQGSRETRVWEMKALRDVLRMADSAVEEQVALREQLRHSQRRETVGSLAGGVAHDVNNQLTVVLGQLELCTEMLGEGNPASAYVKRAHFAAERCAEVTRALLSYSRSAVATQQSAVDLNALLRSVGGLLGRVLGGRIELTLDLDPELPGVLGHASQLEQVVVNLAINARDAMPEGGTLAFRTRRGAEPGWVEVSVVDTGAGMGPEVQARIFEPYFTTKAPGKGTGLGLVMVYGMVKGHGGHVEVESAPGRGTTFTLHLPAQADVPVPAPEAAAPAHGGTPVSLRGLRALVVDDESDLRRIVQILLERAGAEVEVAVDGEEGWQRYREGGPFDVVVSDLRMPRASGMDLLLLIRGVAPAQPFLLMSGFGLEEASAQLAEDPCVGTLAKPFRSQEFLEAAARLLGRAKGIA